MSSKTKNTATKEEAKPALVPKLRFPEFRGAEGWELLPLSRLATRTKQKNRDEKISRVLTNSAEFGVMDQRDFFEKDIATQGNLESYFVVELGSYVYNPRISATAPVGPISKNKIGTGVMSPLYTVFKFEDDGYDYYEHYFKTTGWHTYMRQASSMGARHDRMAISSDDFMAMPLPVPSPDEQQKIAECLSSVDELIAAQARKVDVLKTHKKGLMQQLFPTEGETQPRLRFPEFRNAGEWGDGELGAKASKIGSGITPTGGDKNYKPAGRPFVRSQNVGWGILLLDDVAYIDEETHATFKSTEIKVSDVLLNITGASIGRSAVADERVAEGNVNQHVCIIRTKPNELSPFYLNQLLISKRGQKQIESFQAGGNRQGLNFAQIRSFSVPLPPTLNEQHRIASCLSSLDTLITAETQKLDALKTHKKGLMQQLFPAPAAVA
ncbi:restriction endonuclease subunit S [Acidithiobacillus montserratensis]|uniref:Restriction endonuclease subunit S n=1 Tax=Acidithiobacillus montserratensis TaxID=2729135 RepID=A0ACD5HEX3_9PROT|nr:restriction endonuclease subunit S [Acidithiobacillus montserratensis]MBU2747547.1 restriction endonuclease subunit S [Acidithiobacillus montserratensis]